MTLVAPGTSVIYILVADREMVTQIAGNRGFDKPYKELMVYGPNVVAVSCINSIIRAFSD